MATLDLQVGASTDDCMRILVQGEGTYFGLVLDYIAPGYYAITSYKYGGGMRFLNVTIPKGSVIDTAYLTFTAKYAGTADSVNSRISAEDVDNAPTFADDGDVFDTRFAAHTTARIDWDTIPDWSVDEEGADTTSPEIKTVIKEVVDRAGWASGNALVLFWEDFDDRTTHNDYAIRQAYSFDGNAAKAPKLHIEYESVTEKTSSDSGAGVDAYVSLEKGAAKSSSDAGSGVESTPVQTATLTGNETGSGIEALLARLLAAFDTGSGVEVGGLLQDLVASELGQGCDSLIAKIEMPTKGGGMRLWT